MEDKEEKKGQWVYIEEPIEVEMRGQKGIPWGVKLSKDAEHENLIIIVPVLTHLYDDTKKRGIRKAKRASNFLEDFDFNVWRGFVAP